MSDPNRPNSARGEDDRSPRERPRTIPSAGTSETIDGKTLPRVRVPGPHATEWQDTIVPEHCFIDEFVQYLPPDVIYRREKFLGAIEGQPNGRRFEPIDPQDLAVLASHHMVLWKTVRLKDGIAERPQKFSKATAALAYAGSLRHDEIRELQNLTTYPTVHGEGFQPTAPGWNGGSGIYFDAPAQLQDLRPLRLSDELADRVAVRNELLDLVIDFPFDSDASTENFFGLLLTPILRPAIDGNIPMHVLDCPQERTGKTLLCDSVLGETIVGSSLPVIQLGGDDIEIDKRITALLLGGTNLIHFDNVNTMVDSGSLASLLTSRIYQGRYLGKSRIVRVPNNATIVMSGNNVSASSEISKRVVPIRLVPTDGKPEMRGDFRHKDIAAYVRGHRQRILALLLGMIESWKQAGAPRAQVPFGGFGPWAGTIGGILQHFGFTAWLSNREDWVDRADGVAPYVTEFVLRWAARGPLGKRVRAADLVDLVADNPAFDDVNARSASCRAGALGRRLSKLRDRSFGDFIVRSNRSGHGTTYWLEQIHNVEVVEVSGGQKPQTKSDPTAGGER
jgi:hypothetical protein